MRRLGFLDGAPPVTEGIDGRLRHRRRANASLWAGCNVRARRGTIPTEARRELAGLLRAQKRLQTSSPRQTMHNNPAHKKNQIPIISSHQKDKI